MERFDIYLVSYTKNTGKSARAFAAPCVKECTPHLRAALPRLFHGASMTREVLYQRIRQILQNFNSLASDGSPVCLAVTAPDAALLALLRIPGAHSRTERLAIDKAYTAAKMQYSSSTLRTCILRGRISPAESMDGCMTSIPGGVSLLDEKGDLIAAIGISGRSPAENEALAMRVRDALFGETV